MAAVLALVLVLIASPSFGIPGASRGGPTLAPAAPDSAPVRSTSAVPSNFSYCAPFGASPAAIANLPNYTANVSAVWSVLCNRSAYIAVVNEWGGVRLINSGNNPSYWLATNLSVQTGDVSGGIPTVYFVVSWATACENMTLGPASEECSYDESWDGNLSTDHLSGPFSSERISTCSCGPSFAAASPFPI
ncbi:MAG: hypothetical protein L3K17_10165, partial [Thermoplasmata archaeon]|nr:hypothetical protein [Thermoplasmata archaeon]